MRHNERELKIIAERKKFVALLRATPEEQHCREAFIEPVFLKSLREHTYSYCAVGLYLYKRFGPKEWTSGDEDEFTMERLGLSYEAVGLITDQWNDQDGLTFAEIADRFEAADFPIVLHDETIGGIILKPSPAT